MGSLLRPQLSAATLLSVPTCWGRISGRAARISCVQILFKELFIWYYSVSLDKKTRQQLIFPLILLVVLISFLAVYRIFNLPSNEELIKIVKIYFERYGYPVLFISAFIEAIPVINIYYPGSSIILLAAAFSRQGTLNIFSVVLITSLAFQIAYIINYFIGKHGWYRLFVKLGLGDTLEHTREKIEKHGARWLWLTYFHPNIGALTATSYGILKIPFRNFLITSVLAVLVWDIFWGAFCYFGSGIIEGIIKARWLVVIFAFCWIIFQIIKALRKTGK